MALIKCKECGAEISAQAEQCPRCGYKRGRDNWNFVAFLVIAVAIVAMIGSLISALRRDGKKHIQDAITNATPLPAGRGNIIDESTQAWNAGYQKGYSSGANAAANGAGVPKEWALQLEAKVQGETSGFYGEHREKWQRAFVSGFGAGYKKFAKAAF
jgi:hypothetical protein